MGQLVYRGENRGPLTAATVETAKVPQLGMHGEHGIPTLLQQVDRLARAALA